MKLYFTDRQVPELAKLGDSQRRVVRREAYKNFTSGRRSWERNVRFVNLLAVLCAGVAGLYAYRAVSGWLLAMVIAGVAAGAMAVFSQSLLTKRLRPYFRRYLMEHGNEIERIGEQDVASGGDKPPL
jgi:hypothetical protein